MSLLLHERQSVMMSEQWHVLWNRRLQNVQRALWLLQMSSPGAGPGSARHRGRHFSLTDDWSGRSQVTVCTFGQQRPHLLLLLIGSHPEARGAAWGSGRIGIKPFASNISFPNVQRDYSTNIKRGVRSSWALQMKCVHLLPTLAVCSADLTD